MYNITNVRLTLINIFLCHLVCKTCKFGIRDFVKLRTICLRVCTINVGFEESSFLTIILIFNFRT